MAAEMQVGSIGSWRWYWQTKAAGKSKTEWTKGGEEGVWGGDCAPMSNGANCWGFLDASSSSDDDGVVAISDDFKPSLFVSFHILRQICLPWLLLLLWLFDKFTLSYSPYYSSSLAPRRSAARWDQLFHEHFFIFFPSFIMFCVQHIFYKSCRSFKN